MSLFKRIAASLNRLRVVSDGDGSAQQQPPTTRDVAGPLAGVLAGLISGVLATWIAQDVLKSSFTLAIVIVLSIALLVLVLIQIRGLPFGRKPVTLIAIFLSVAIIEFMIIAYLYVSNQAITTYLVFDATESTIPYYGELIKNIQLAAQVQNPKSLGGLRIYGGGVSQRTDCADTVQLVAPVQAQEFASGLDRTFQHLNPKGHASLTIAVSRALTEDLRGYKGPIKLIVITSGLDSICEAKSSGLFREAVRLIRETKAPETTIAIIGVGDLNADEEERLQSYADEFGGKYLNASKEGSLSSVITAPPSYFSEHGKAGNNKRSP